MRSYSIPEKIVKMVKVMYSGNECAVIDGSGVYNWFEIKIDVKQGCCLGFFSCLLWVMRRKPNMGTVTGVRWKFSNVLEYVYLDFADERTLISS